MAYLFFFLAAFLAGFFVAIGYFLLYGTFP
jgi:hypothetical protein